jgi:hypothetical protein
VDAYDGVLYMGVARLYFFKAVTVMLPDIGKVKLAIVENGYNATLENTRFIITDMLDAPA